jgi:hypothetical protein
VDSPASWGISGVIVGCFITSLTTFGVEWLSSTDESNLDKEKCI